MAVLITDHVTVIAVQLWSSLLKDFSLPEALQEDMYAAAGIPTNYHWVIITQADTGTELHLDLPYTRVA